MTPADRRLFMVYRTTADGGSVAVRSFPIIGRGGLLTRAEAEIVQAHDPGAGWWIGAYGLASDGKIVRLA